MAAYDPDLFEQHPDPAFGGFAEGNRTVPGLS